MKFAVHYSYPAADLLQQGLIHFDYFKCPAWPHIVAEAAALAPTYVHFPLLVGQGQGHVIDSEEKRPTDWQRLLPLREQTHTPFINIHLIARAADYPFIPLNSTNRYHIEQVTENFIADVSAVCQKFGAENVIIENVYDDAATILRIALLPEVVHTVIRETGCGFLLDIAHAYLAARYLASDPQAYTAALPTQHIRELHIAGIQPLTGRWGDLFQAHFEPAVYHKRFANRLMDHLPLRDEDWHFTRWALNEIHSGRWAKPWLVALEYGGVGPLWEAVTERAVLQQQVPLLARLISDPQVSLNDNFVAQ